jgi:hypothetical protein
MVQSSRRSHGAGPVDRRSYLSRFTGWLLPLISHPHKTIHDEVKSVVTATLGFHANASSGNSSVQWDRQIAVPTNHDWSEIPASRAAERDLRGTFHSEVSKLEKSGGRVAVPPLPVGADSCIATYHAVEDVMFEDIPEENVRVHEFSLQSSPREEFSLQSSPRSPRSSKFSSKYSSHRSSEPVTQAQSNRRSQDEVPGCDPGLPQCSSLAANEEHEIQIRAPRKAISVEEVCQEAKRAALTSEHRRAPLLIFDSIRSTDQKGGHHGDQCLEPTFQSAEAMRTPSFDMQHASRNDRSQAPSWSIINTVHEGQVFTMPRSCAIGNSFGLVPTLKRPLRVGTEGMRTESLISRIEKETAMLEEFEGGQMEEEITKWGMLC